MRTLAVEYHTPHMNPRVFDPPCVCHVRYKLVTGRCPCHPTGFYLQHVQIRSACPVHFPRCDPLVQFNIIVNESLRHG